VARNRGQCYLSSLTQWESGHHHQRYSDHWSQLATMQGDKQDIHVSQELITPLHHPRGNLIKNTICQWVSFSRKLDSESIHFMGVQITDEDITPFIEKRNTTSDGWFWGGGDRVPSYDWTQVSWQYNRGWRGLLHFSPISQSFMHPVPTVARCLWKVSNAISLITPLWATVEKVKS